MIKCEEREAGMCTLRGLMLAALCGSVFSFQPPIEPGNPKEVKSWDANVL